MTSAVRNGEYPTTSTNLLFINDEQRRWTMRTRLSVVGATAIILGGALLSAPVSAARHFGGDFAPMVSATREAVFLSAMALPVLVALDSVGLRPITTVTMAIAIGIAMTAPRLSLVVVTD
jgi:hypothetical protein